jgi:elongation factor Ts
MEISASMVMDLRKQTGLSMMDCKKALVESGGDQKKAIEWLRERGLKKLAERADNATPNGRIFVHQDAGSKQVGMAAIGCESEPVVNTDDFQALGKAVALAAATTSNPTPESVLEFTPPGGKSVGTMLEDVRNRIREKIVITNVAAGKEHVAYYVHHNGMVGVMVEFSQAFPDQLGQDVCMHIAALNPKSLKREDVPADEVTREREMYVKEVTASGKPANIVDNIVNGKMNRWYSEFVLLEQPFVKDDKKSVQQVLKDASAGLTINRFVRFKVGA